MYQPTLGRFLSRDPLSPDGVDVLYDNNWFGAALDRMRNLYGYVGNNPVNWIDPSGLQANSWGNRSRQRSGKCVIGVHCWKVRRGADWFKVTLGIHCGFTITDETGTYRLDGLNTPTETVGIGRTDEPSGFTPDWPATDFTSYAPAVCRCLRTYKQKFNKAGIDYEPGCANSNWALNCMASHCGITITFGAEVGGPQPPIGFNCQECVEWGYFRDFPGPRVRCCVRAEPKQCP